MALTAGILTIIFIAGLIYGHKYPPTDEDCYRTRERRKKAALFLAATTVSTRYHLVKGPEKRRR